MNKIIITETSIEIEGFDDVEFKRDHLGCRDVGDVAMVWAIQRLADDLRKSRTGDWENETSCMAD